MLYLLIYFLAIYLTIVEYVFLPKEAKRFIIMQGIHLTMTVPSAYFLAKELTQAESVSAEFYRISLITIVFTIISLLLSGIVVRKIK